MGQRGPCVKQSKEKGTATRAVTPWLDLYYLFGHIFRTGADYTFPMADPPPTHAGLFLFDKHNLLFLRAVGSG